MLQLAKSVMHQLRCFDMHSAAKSAVDNAVIALITLSVASNAVIADTWSVVTLQPKTWFSRPQHHPGMGTPAPITAL